MSRAKVKTRQRGKLPDPARMLDWYDSHRRDLPWRARPGETADPYRVWLSEIMLQQTTVPVVGPYFLAFLKRWPTVRRLARADLHDVMKEWAGLGYYRRARMLHECANFVVKQHGGEFPADEKELRMLPGIGPYTAAAIAAIAFGRRANVVDGNVERVMARMFAVRQPLAHAKAHLRALAEKILPDNRSGDYAQALMDLGATICAPRKPKCVLCPWQKDCRAFALDLTDKIPASAEKKIKPSRHATAFWLTNARGEVLLRRRPPEGLLGSMIEVPSSTWEEKPGRDALQQAPVKASWRILPGEVRHSFTHFNLYIKVAAASIKSRSRNGLWVELAKVNEQGLPSVMSKIARYATAHARVKR